LTSLFKILLKDKRDSKKEGLAVIGVDGRKPAIPSYKCQLAKWFSMLF
jgi:hypothetical protein